jgi:diguanylate cyclase (GGDEF)-like protein
MPGEGERRVLVAAGASEEALFRTLFAEDCLRDWQPLGADSFEQARFLLQHDTCDLAVVDQSVAARQAREGLAWLTSQHEVPVLLLAGASPDTVTRALRDGAHVWLPRDLALAHPPLLAAAMERATEFTRARRSQRRTADNLRQCRRQVDRLVGLLWRSVPLDTEHHWLTQRHLLERMQEEVARADRYGGPLSVALGEIHTAPLGDEPAPEPVLADWMTARITRAKRRCDVAGQYGLQGFLLLLVHTPERGAITCCRRLQEVLENPGPAPPGGPHGPVRAYFGVASYSPEASTPRGLLRCAEQRLEAARAVKEERLVAEG